MSTFTKVLSALLLYGLAWSCSTTAFQEYEIDKPSPDGSFRVRVKVKRGEPGKTLDEARFQFLRGQEVIYVWNWRQPDQWEPSFDTQLPIQWIDNRVLKIGGDNKAEYFDEVIVTNHTGESLKFICITYDTSHTYWIFWLSSGEQIKIQANPWFTSKEEQYSFGYTGVTQSGKQFSDVIKGGNRQHPGDPKRFSITILAEDLQ